MRVRGLAAMVFLAIMATVPPARAAPGTITVENVDSLRVVARWDLGPEPVYYRSAVDGDDWYLMAFATPDDRARLFRIDLDSGRIRWSIDLRCASGNLVAGHGIVLFVDRDCSRYPAPRMTAVHASTGRTMWTAAADLARIVGPIVILSRFLTPASGHFAAHTWGVQAASGRRLWTYRSPGAVSRFHTPIVARDALYLLDDDDLVAMDPRTGEVRWRIPGPADGQGLWDADAHGPYVLRQPGVHNMLVALDGDTGAVRWRVADAIGAMFGDGAAFVTVADPTLGFDHEARSTADGSVLWTGSPNALMIGVIDGVLYGLRYSPATELLVAFDAATGRELAVYPGTRDTDVTSERVLMATGDGAWDVYEPADR